MGRVCGVVVVRHVAVGARPAGDAVIAELGVVTLRAWQSDVRPRQGKPGGRMIERRPAPAGYRRVAGVARRWKSRRLMARIGGAVVIRHVAVGARPAGDVVVAEGGSVALRALDSRVRPREREPRAGMIERRT